MQMTIQQMIALIVGVIAISIMLYFVLSTTANSPPPIQDVPTQMLPALMIYGDRFKSFIRSR